MRRWLPGLFVATLVTCLPAIVQAKEEAATVLRVIDGDTIEVHIVGTVEKVRLIGVDTPETVDPRPQMFRPVQESIPDASISAVFTIRSFCGNHQPPFDDQLSEGVSKPAAGVTSATCFTHEPGQACFGTRDRPGGRMVAPAHGRRKL